MVTSFPFVTSLISDSTAHYLPRICYAYSKDLGYTWRNGQGDVIADLRKGETIRNDAPGIVAFDIAKGSGLMNQEAQTVDCAGGVHVLNRDTLNGAHMWKHYYRTPEGEFGGVFVASESISTPRANCLSTRRLELARHPPCRWLEARSSGCDQGR